VYVKVRIVGVGVNLLYQVKREIQRIHLNGCRCNERLITKTEGSKLLAYTGLLGQVVVGRVWDCMMCTCVSEEGGNGEEGTDSEVPSLLAYTLRYVSLADLGRGCQFGLREPMHLCTCVSESILGFTCVHV
jgi:hypothetical protein